MARSKLLLEAHLKALRLPTFLREYDKLARQCAAESLDSRSFLQQLCELELLDREQRATERRSKAAKFPVTKSLDTFDFPSLPALNKKLVLELARCEFIDRRENVPALSLVARIGMETEFPLSPSGSVRRCVRTQAVRARSLCSGLFGRVGSP